MDGARLDRPSQPVAGIVELAGESPLAFVAGLERIRTQRVTVHIDDGESSQKTG